MAILARATRDEDIVANIDADKVDVANFSATARVSEGNNGLPLIMERCTNAGFNKKLIGKVAVVCEQLVANGDVVHCGLLAEAADDPSLKRRYDLGPRPFEWQYFSLNPLDILAVAIKCTEQDKEKNDLRGVRERKQQFTWHTAPLVATLRTKTFGELEEFIREVSVVGKYYDLVGGNCQHFAFRLYELMLKKPCGSIAAPVANTLADIRHALGSHVDAVLKAAKDNSAQFQKEQGAGIKN